MLKIGWPRLLGVMLALLLTPDRFLGAQEPELGAQIVPAPNRRPDEGKGPFKTRVIRGAMLIDGTGGPPRGPVDIVVENNRIKSIRSAGTPGLPMKPNR